MRGKGKGQPKQRKGELEREWEKRRERQSTNAGLLLKIFNFIFSRFLKEMSCLREFECAKRGYSAFWKEYN